MEFLVLLLPLGHVIELVVYLMNGGGDVFQLSNGLTVGSVIFPTHPVEDSRGRTTKGSNRVPGSSAKSVPTSVGHLKRRNRTTGYRWYRSYTVPCDPRINPELHATTFRLRLDTTDEDKNRKRGRAENLRLHPEGTPAFDDLIALRPVSESLNSWIKNHQVPHRRAPVVGHARMRVHLLFQALYLNIRATIARMLRTGQQLPFTT